MFTGGAHDLFADRDAAGKEDVIKPLMQQCLILCASAFDDGDVFPREAGGDQLADDGGGRGRICRRLEDAAVACGKRTDKRLHQQHERIVPRGHDERDAIRLADDKAVRRELRQRGQHMAVFGKAAQMTPHIGKLAEGHAGFAHIGFRCGFAEVALERGVNLRLHAEDGVMEFFQALKAEIKAERRSGFKESALERDEFFNLLGVHAFCSFLGMSLRYIVASSRSSISTGTRQGLTLYRSALLVPKGALWGLVVCCKN